jgi:peptide chain release factor subunit 3
MNPNAGKWTPSPVASEWKPPANTMAPPAPERPVPVASAVKVKVPTGEVSLGSSSSKPKPKPTTTITSAPAASSASAADAGGDADADEVDDMDEHDPLWKAVLKIANNDRVRARKMISNPDGLMKYPECVAVLESEEWEAGADEEAAEMELAKQMEEKATVTTGAAVAEEELLEEEVTDVSKEPWVPGDPREHVNLVFIGHVDAGKSTLSGNILYLTENVDKRTIERYEREAKELNRESWFLAFIMDTNEEERAKGKTVEVGRAIFHTPDKRYTIMDAPGHKNYVPNMIMGASQADVGILVISARRGEFETGFDRGGQTREHALLAKTLGVTYLVVVINKMDDPTVNWDKERFDECCNKLRPFLKSCSYKIKKEVKFLPISGLSGANVKDPVDPKVCPWWSKSVASGENNTTNATLLGLLDTLSMPDRDANGPVCIPVLDRYNDRGTIAMGKVESGTLLPGKKVMIMPTRNVYKISQVWANEEIVDGARPGENVLLKIDGAGVEDVQKGYVICTQPACRAVSKMICDLMLMDMPENTRIMTAGFQCMFHCHTAEEECVVVKLFETKHPKTGALTKDPNFAAVGMKVKVMLELPRTVPCDTFKNAPFLGRITLRTEGKTIAIGIISKLPPKKD